MSKIEAGSREQQGKRNRQRHDERAAHIAQEHKQNNDNENDSFRQIMQNGVGGVMHQVAAIEEGNDLHARRKNPVVQLLNLLMNSLECRIRVGALTQQHDAADDVIIVDNAPVRKMGRAGELSQPDFRPLLDGRDIFDADGSAVLGQDYGVLNVAYIADQADFAHVYLLQAFVDKA